MEIQLQDRPEYSSRQQVICIRSGYVFRSGQFKKKREVVMKRSAAVIVGCILSLLSQTIFSQTVIGFDAFTADSYYASPLQFTEDGIQFVLTDQGGEAGYEFRSMSSYPGELQLGDTGGSGATIKTTLTHRDGWRFDLNSIDLMVLISAPYWIIKGYQSGSHVSGSPVTFSLVPGNPYQTIHVNFLQVDMVTIEENPVYTGGYEIWCDQFVVDNVTDSSLPVSLSFFHASRIPEGIILEWATESECNNLGYILERSEEGDKTWLEMGSYKTHDALSGQVNTSTRTDYQFTDNTAELKTSYYYRLSDVSISGEINTYPAIFTESETVQMITVLDAAYPNPFNPQTFISYHLAEDTHVTIHVFDMLGRLVKTLYRNPQSAGSHHVYWHGTDENGLSVSNGGYFIRMQAGNTTQMQKVMFLK